MGSGNLPVRYPLYIGIIALARFLVLDIAQIDAFKMFAISGSVLLIALAILIVRYGHVRFPYTEDD
jgi:protein PsiE